MKKIIAMLLVIMVLLSGCDSSDVQHKKTKECVILRLPNGEIIEGCPEYLVVDNGWSRVMINGVEYRTGNGNIAVVKGSVEDE